MKILKLFFIIFFLFSFNHLKANNEDTKNTITKNLRCLICQGQSIYDSDSAFANSIKILVDKKLDEGGPPYGTNLSEVKSIFNIGWKIRREEFPDQSIEPRKGREKLIIFEKS